MTFQKDYDLEIVSITVLVEPSITETVCEYWLAINKIKSRQLACENRAKSMP
jgi:hypothetical protein